MHIEHFNARVDTQAVEHQQNANNGNEYQRQNLHFGMGVDEVRDGIDEHHHKENCEHNRNDHDNKVVRQTNSSDYGVDGEHDIHDHNGGHSTNKSDGFTGLVRITLTFFFL